MNINKVFLYGNLTRDPELKMTASSTAVASFGVATNRTFKGKDGNQQEQTEYHNIIAFGRTADVMAQYLKKGRAVYIEGRLQTRSWEAEGKKNYRTEVIVDSFQFGASAGAPSEASGEVAVPAAEHPLEKEFSKTPDPEKTYSSSLGNDSYPDEINPSDIPF